MERIERGFSSLAGCYALLATLACSFLIYAHWAFTTHPPQWADQVPHFVIGSSSGQPLHFAQIISATRVAALYFHDRMHTTQLYFAVFAAVWVACLLWMLLGKQRRRIALRRGALWIGAVSLFVLGAAALYGVGTRGAYAHRIPVLPHVSDALAGAFMLALPLIAWSRTRRRASDDDFDAALDDPDGVSASRLERLGLGTTMSVVPRPEDASRLEIRPEARPGNPLPAGQTSQAEDHASIAINRLMARATASVSVEPQQPPVDVASANPVMVTPSETILVAPPAPVSAVPSIALVQAEPVAALVSEQIAVQVAEPISAMPVALVAEHVDTEAVAVRMSESLVEAPEAVYEPLPEWVAELPAEHNIVEPVIVEPVAFRVSSRMDEAVDGSAALVAEERVAALPAEHRASETVAFQIHEAIAEVAAVPVAVVAEEPVAAIAAVHFMAEPVAVQDPEPIALVVEEPVAVAIPDSIAFTEPAEISVEHFAAEHFALETPEPTAMVIEEPHTVAVPEPLALVAEEPVIALPPVDTEMPPKPVTVAQLEPLPVFVATLEPIAMSAEPLAVLPLASAAAVTPAEPATVVQPEPFPVAVAPLEPMAAVAADPIAVLPAAQAAVVIPAEPVTVAQPEPLPVPTKLAEPIEFVPREPATVVPPAPVAMMPPKPKPVSQPEPTPTAPAREIANQASQESGDEFLHGLSTLNRSWRRIEAMQEEMDEWFKQRRRQALAQATTPPGMRNSNLGNNLVQDLGEKLAAIDAQWLEIRNAALGISRAVGDASDTDQNK
ncbi:MAG: hypothetical protein JOY95_01030 [Silvibacterium sp.]|nr:hypothetical protein [Silvibacterium sp.]